jgi:C-terminal processing protease CtpA/Prc
MVIAAAQYGCFLLSFSPAIAIGKPRMQKRMFRSSGLTQQHCHVRRMASVILMGFICLTAFAQQKGPTYAIGASMIGTKAPCLFIAGVYKKSPAADAGIRSGDRIVSIDGTVVITLQDATRLLHSEGSIPITLQLVRDQKAFSVTVRRQPYATILERNGVKMLDVGMIAPVDATEAEMSHKIKRIEEHIADRAFPLHYPNDLNLYYAGFEIFILKDPRQIAVGGIENAPASRAGIHWGDIITSVNGIDVRNKSVAELEKLFSSGQTATMTLAINRDGIKKTFTFPLEQAGKILRENQHQLVNGKMIPLGIPREYQSCFD